jgi:hypothetical protein
MGARHRGRLPARLRRAWLPGRGSARGASTAQTATPNEPSKDVNSDDNCGGNAMPCADCSRAGRRRTRKHRQTSYLVTRNIPRRQLEVVDRMPSVSALRLSESLRAQPSPAPTQRWKSWAASSCPSGGLDAVSRASEVLPQRGIDGRRLQLRHRGRRDGTRVDLSRDRSSHEFSWMPTSSTRLENGSYAGRNPLRGRTSIRPFTHELLLRNRLAMAARPGLRGARGRDVPRSCERGPR